MMLRLRNSRWTAVLGLALTFLLLPSRADAHLPSIGLGPVYDGIFHLLLSPEDVIPVIAIALLAGQKGAAFGRRVLWTVPLSWFVGGFIGMYSAHPRSSALTCISFLVLGVWLASNLKISLPVLTGMSALLGLFHGYLNGTGVSRFDDGTYFLVGLALTVFVIVAVFSSLVIPLQQQWTRIVVRVAGSWIAATGLLMLGWAFRRSP